MMKIKLDASCCRTDDMSVRHLSEYKGSDNGRNNTLPQRGIKMCESASFMQMIDHLLGLFLQQRGSKVKDKTQYRNSSFLP